LDARLLLENLSLLFDHPVDFPLEIGALLREKVQPAL